MKTIEITFLDQLKSVVCGFNGVFVLRNELTVDPEMEEIYEKVYSSIKMASPHEDKQNLHGDLSNFKSDFKKSVKAYKEEKSF